MADDTPCPVQLRALLVTLLAGATGSSEAKWRKVLGDIERLNLTFDPRSNWRLEPAGTVDERKVIEKAVAVVREAHPYVQW